jgi:hypothetical protein
MTAYTISFHFNELQEIVNKVIYYKCASYHNEHYYCYFVYVCRVGSQVIQFVMPSKQQLGTSASVSNVRLYLSLENSDDHMSLGVFTYRPNPTVTSLSPLNTIVRLVVPHLLFSYRYTLAKRLFKYMLVT